MTLPTISSASYNASTGTLEITGNNFSAYTGSTNDIDISKLTITGNGGSTYVLTSDDVEITSSTEFSITLNAADQLQLAGLLNKNGTSSGTGTTYNIAALDDWAPGADTSTDISDLNGNAITVSNVLSPTLTSATFDTATGILSLIGNNLPAYPGTSNDIDVLKLTITGNGGSTYVLTSDDVEITSSTEFSITLNAADQLQLAGLLNKNGTSSGTGTTYNIAAVDDWAPGADTSTDISDLNGNAITVSNVLSPTLTSATFDTATGILSLIGNNLPAYPGTSNDIDVSKLTITGNGGSTYTLTSTDVELTSNTSASITLNTSDQTNLVSLLNKNGTSSSQGTTYNIAAADNWVLGADAAINIEDLTSNSIDVINIKPTIRGPSGSAGDSSSLKSINENTTAIHTFTANESVTWSLNGGADASKFSINSSTGALTFSSAPDYESPTDSNSGNDYVVVVRATDSTGHISDQTLTISVNDVDDTSPSITGPSGSAGDSSSLKSINENTTAIHTFTANESVTWSLNGGADASKFSINSSTGALTFSSAPDYESPTDSNSGNDYVVVVRATDSIGNTSDQTLTISVNDVDDTSPSITGPSGSAGDSSSSKSINENTTAIHTFTANESVTWSLNGGADASKFSINSSTGALTFSSAPDYESPTDSNSGNDYVVVVRATDSIGNTSDQTLTISVSDVNETPSNLSLSSSSFNENINSGSTVAVLSSSDPDSSDTHTYSFISGSGDTDNNSFTIDGSSLKIKASPDYETKSSYSIRLQTTDSGEKQVKEFAIGSLSNDAPSGVSTIFSKETEVFGVKIYATSTTLDSDIQHAASVMAEYLDNNGDGKVDDSAVINAMVQNKATLVMFKDEAEQESSNLSALEGSELNFQNLWGAETIPNGAASGQFDASLEEVLHLITDYGYVKAYPAAFGLSSSLLTEAMDVARGGNFQEIPSTYPSGAWYTYYDTTSDYATQATEYLYWGLTSILGGQDFNGRLDSIKDEWTLNTLEKVQATDTKLYSLLTDSQYKLPTILPNGDYSVPSQSTFTKTLTVNDLNELIGTTGKDTITSTSKTDFLDGGTGSDTSVYSGKFSDYAFTRGTNTLEIADQRTTGTTDGTDTLKNIEYIQFSDQTVEESKVDVVKTYTGQYHEYKFYNRGNGTYEIKTDSGYDDITGYPLLRFSGEDTTSALRDVSAIADIKATFDQVTGLTDPSGEMFQLYNAAFKRFPDAEGLKYWINVYSSGINTKKVVAASFVRSAEFKSRYGENVTTEEYVTTLYRNVFDRLPDEDGFNYWVGSLNKEEQSRSDVLMNFAISNENDALFTEMTGLS
ncbi:DUF4214 domain-containing protein [Prochlorococcus marinus]|uniref:DUF4214 domain-containing protein n=1 Tax=Prochlorococcus marinus TaxID=1219 RepID=UPI0022B47476|nr:DUF4214 domain-containing protein [Prochlorococcus marinus]